MNTNNKCRELTQKLFKECCDIISDGSKQLSNLFKRLYSGAFSAIGVEQIASGYHPEEEQKGVTQRVLPHSVSIV